MTRPSPDLVVGFLDPRIGKRRTSAEPPQFMSSAKHRTHWECPCGHEEPKPHAKTSPVRTVVSLREPVCPFCGREFREEYVHEDEERSA
jgi:hypothetical protein